jgi:hypothetical protein
MLIQRASAIAASVCFLVVAIRLVFMIPRSGVLLGFVLLFVIFALWYFVLQRDFFRSPIIEFMGKFVPVALIMIALASTILALLGVFPWLPPGLIEGSAGSAEQLPSM